MRRKQLKKWIYQSPQFLMEAWLKRCDRVNKTNSQNEKKSFSFSFPKIMLIFFFQTPRKQTKKMFDKSVRVKNRE